MGTRQGQACGWPLAWPQLYAWHRWSMRSCLRRAPGLPRMRQDLQAARHTCQLPVLQDCIRQGSC